MGKALENEIQNLAITLYPQKHLRLYKNNPTVIQAGGKLQYAKRRQSEAPVDFFGYFHNIIVMLEAKAIKVKDMSAWQKARFPIGDPRRIPPHQLRALLDCEAAKGLAFFIVRLYEEPTMRDMHILLSPDWLAYVEKTNDTPVSLPFSSLVSSKSWQFEILPNLSDLPHKLKEIAQHRMVPKIVISSEHVTKESLDAT